MGVPTCSNQVGGSAPRAGELHSFVHAGVSGRGQGDLGRPQRPQWVGSWLGGPDWPEHFGHTQGSSGQRQAAGLGTGVAVAAGFES